MQANTLYLTCDTVQLESALLRYFDSADTELLSDLIHQLSVYGVFDDGLI